MKLAEGIKELAAVVSAVGILGGWAVLNNPFVTRSQFGQYVTLTERIYANDLRQDLASWQVTYDEAVASGSVNMKRRAQAELDRIMEELDRLRTGKPPAPSNHEGLPLDGLDKEPPVDE